MEMNGEIFAVPFFGQSHLLPCMELCRLFCSMQYKTTLIISSDLTSAVPTALLNHQLFSVAEFTTPVPAPPQKGFKPKPGPNPLLVHFQQMGGYIESLLESRPVNRDPARPVFAVADSLMCWSKGVFMKFGIPVVALLTFGAAGIAMEHATWKADVGNLQPGETRILPGLPEYMAFNFSDLRRHNHTKPDKGIGPAQSVQSDPVGPRPKKKSFPTEPGDEPSWIDDTKGAVAFLINTCEELERIFINYVSGQIGAPVWGVGPLLPQEYWNVNTTTFTEHGIRPNRQSNYSEEQVIRWLDTKPHRSVIYISFGTQAAPKLEELDGIATALEETNRPFIWVFQTGSEVVTEYYYPDGLDEKVGNRGLIIQGWAPQLLILNHPSVGGFLTHCGWSSTMEAIGRGLPTLAWPRRGDQFYNAKSIEHHLKVGYRISKKDDASEIITKDDIIEGIERLMDDEELHERAKALCNEVFKHGFPASSLASFKALKDFMSQIAIK